MLNVNMNGSQLRKDRDTCLSDLTVNVENEWRSMERPQNSNSKKETEINACVF